MDGGRVEHSGEEILEILECRLSSFLGGVEGSNYPDSLSISTQRESVLIWETEGASPLSPIISWQDSRMESYCENLSSKEKEIIWEKTGLHISSYFSAPKLHYLISEVCPKLDSRKKYKFGTLDTWILYILSRGERFCTDYSSASRTALLNLETLSWDSELGEIFGIDISTLPELKECDSSEFGYAYIGDHSISISSVIGDQQGALFFGVKTGLSDCTLVYGTGVFIMKLLPSHISFQTIKTLFSSESKIFITIAWKNRLEGVRFAVECSLSNSGNAQRYICQLFNFSPECFRDWIEDIEVAKVILQNRILSLPFFSGKWSIYEKGLYPSALIGLRVYNSSREILYSFWEGLAFSIRYYLAYISSVVEIKSLLTGGRSTEYAKFVELQSNYLSIPIHRSTQVEVSGIGAALLSFQTLDYHFESNTVFPSGEPGVSEYIEKRYTHWLKIVSYLSEASALF